jgi:small GTP-binding protein
MQALLDDRQRALFASERALLDRLLAALPATAASEAEQAALAAVRRELDEVFLLVVVGEFNSGKSALINTLLGSQVLAEGVTPTTAQIHVVDHGPDLRLVDTPGTNAVLTQHQEITEEYVPRADLVLFVTSADRPFSESERAFLQGVRDWGKKIVVVVNKVDILEDQAAIDEVVAFVRRQSIALLGAEPPIFPLSVRARRQGGAGAERFARLEEYVRATLDQAERIRLKLSSPLGVADRLIGAARERVGGRLEGLRGDVDTLAAIERQLAGYAQDLRQDFTLRLSRVDNLLHDLRARGHRFLDETVRIGRVLDLLNAARLRAAYEREVVGDVHTELEREVSALIDWIVERNHRQWQDVVKALNLQAAAHRQRIVGEVSGEFEINRKQLLESLGRAARQVTASYDKEAEARALTESVQLGLAAVGAVEIGALGLGAVLLHTLTRALDPLGVLAAGGLAVLGLYILPARRRSAQRDLDAKIADLRQRLAAAMTTQFDRETERAVQTLREAISPYTRFVRGEKERLEASVEELGAIAGEVSALRSKI